MRRIENMKTLVIHRAALDLTARYVGLARTVYPVTRLELATKTVAAIEQQLDEIQHTFGVRWEW
jgi:hypothetical protein